jgi:hypothetical protein
MGLILFIAAMIGQIILLPTFFVYTVIKYVITLQFRKLDSYLYYIAFAIDQAGNVWGGVMMNDCLLKKGSSKQYGNPDETISYATGMGASTGTLNKLGILVAKGLNALDKDHVEKAAKTNQNNTDDPDFTLRKKA